MTEFSSDKTPALHRLLCEGYECQMVPFGCSECHFASPTLDYRGEDDINYADPDEGHYDCSLLDQQGIWGEEGSCEIKHWQDRAIWELITLLSDERR